MDINKAFKVLLIAGIFPVVNCLHSCVSATGNTDNATSNVTELAQTPPMGWNSFDAYDSRINEEEFRNTVDYMDTHLKNHGWEYAVVDYIWFHTDPGNWDNPGKRFGHPDIKADKDGKPLESLVMDEYGRLLPAQNRFPSVTDEEGFKALADYVHSKGMKFGIHIMRGIPREAYYKELPIKGTNYTAKDIGEPWDTCGWNNHMYGVDASKPGAQEYYNSLFELYAKWGVDFIKADDTMFPPYHKDEIELISNAAKECGRPIVLSLSCGEAPISQAAHVSEYAHMWRISGDFWDNWESLEHNFDLLNAWSPFIGPGHWPDADMIPFGHISLTGRPHGSDRLSGFTVPEHYTLMTLWSIAKSPLMIGSDLLTTPQETIDTFFKNDDLIYINQQSTDNRQVIKHNDSAIWIATDPANGDRFVALFNLSDDMKKVAFELEVEGLRGKFQAEELWTNEVKEIEKVLSSSIEPHGAMVYRLSNSSNSL